MFLLAGSECEKEYEENEQGFPVHARKIWGKSIDLNSAKCVIFAAVSTLIIS
jgi:hypothetical protein